MYIKSTTLNSVRKALRTNKIKLSKYIAETCDRIDSLEDKLHALVKEKDRRSRLLHESELLKSKFPDWTSRPPLFGLLFGVKDIINVDGFITKAGSNLPYKLFAGHEASCVTKLKQLGGIVLGKTITTEFACASKAGPTRNPNNLAHTPGGSSSGSAAAVAAGYCPLAIGTQTGGSTIRPAAFCGIIGFKPSFGQIPTDGVVTVSNSSDHIGLFAQDINTIEYVASLLCSSWDQFSKNSQPTLGVPIGSYLGQVRSQFLSVFKKQVLEYEKAGYSIKKIDLFSNIELINQQHYHLVIGEMARIHKKWFNKYEEHYSSGTRSLIRNGKCISDDKLKRLQVYGYKLRNRIETIMDQEEIDLWISPAALGSAPEGLKSTGDATMNLPWSYAGLPAITVPLKTTIGDLPLGIQISAKYMEDYKLVECAKMLSKKVV